MKNSKVDHTRSAVGIEEHNNGKSKGIMYKFPQGESKCPTLPLSNRVEDRGAKTQALYSIFNQIQEGTAPTEPQTADFKGNPEKYAYVKQRYEVKLRNFKRVKHLRKNGRTLIQEVDKILFLKDKWKKIGVNDNNTVFREIRNSRIKGEVKASNVGNPVYTCTYPDGRFIKPDELISVYLRSGLRSGKEGLLCLCANLGSTSITKENEESISKFLDVLRGDFQKYSSDKELGDIEKSIENQNLVFQPENEGFRMPIPPKTSKKTDYSEDKEGFEVFLTQFADLDASKRTEMLRKLRRLLDIYFTGSCDTGKFDVWNRHNAGKTAEGTFVEIPVILKERITRDKKEEKNAIDELKTLIRKQNQFCFLRARKIVGVNVKKADIPMCEEAEKIRETVFQELHVNSFWLRHFSSAVERILAERLSDCIFKLDNSYLIEKVWKDALNAISIKYIALGKSVYNFGMDDLNSQEKEITLGKANKSSINQITSFDYEMIKARETLQRELAVHIAYAANNLSRATVSVQEAVESEQMIAEASDGKRDADMDDLLLWRKDEIEKYCRYSSDEHEWKAVLQFFGGKSNWDGIIDYSDMHSCDFVFNIKEAVFALRNLSFHFMIANSVPDTGNTLFAKMFAVEAKRCIGFECARFESNNLTKFYSVSDLNKTLAFLYSKTYDKAAQVPAFNRVIGRTGFSRFLRDEMNYPNPHFEQDKNGKYTEMWRSALYYLYKEIYYSRFLVDGEALARVISAVDSLKPDPKQTAPVDKQECAIHDFQKRIQELNDKNRSLQEICQEVMTEYNYQNNQRRKVKSSDDSIMDRDIFQHYRVLLWRSLAIAFKEYLKANSDVFGYLNKPVMNRVETDTLELDSPIYDELIKEVESDDRLQKWYVTSRLLSARSLNLLVGSMRSYVYYVEDIQRRAQSIGPNNLHVDESANVISIEKVIKVIEVSIRLANGYPLSFDDYFVDEEDYAKYLYNFVGYGKVNDASYLVSLSAFARNKDEDHNIYTDELNPIFNRSILRAKLYGSESILKDIYSDRKITEKDLEACSVLEKSIEDYKKTGVCKSAQDQKNVRDYMRMKNRIELRDLEDYGELINEFLGQLINWSFIRERDLLYFQLGFHYKCLMNEEAVKYADYMHITTKDKTIHNAILYQIMGMYINGIGVFVKDNSNRFIEVAKIAGAGTKVGKFCNYASDFEPAPYAAFYAGLEVFENVNEHEDIVRLRNAIDHFKYYTKRAGSIMELYSEVFDRFFTYDMKYQKTVTDRFRNILLKHRINAKVSFGKGTKKTDNGTRSKECARIIVRELFSERDFCKYEGGVVEIDSHDTSFLSAVGDILYFGDAMPEKPRIAPERKMKDCPNKAKEDKKDRDRQQKKWKK